MLLLSFTCVDVSEVTYGPDEVHEMYVWRDQRGVRVFRLWKGYRSLVFSVLCLPALSTTPDMTTCGAIRLRVREQDLKHTTCRTLIMFDWKHTEKRQEGRRYNILSSFFPSFRQRNNLEGVVYQYLLVVKPQMCTPQVGRPPNVGTDYTRTRSLSEIRWVGSRHLQTVRRRRRKGCSQDKRRRVTSLHW